MSAEAADTSAAKKRLILNLFEMNCVSHITHGLWRLPGNNRERFNDIGYWTELARLLESGGFDAVFIADVTRASDALGWRPRTGVTEGVEKLARWVQENRVLFA